MMKITLVIEGIVNKDIRINAFATRHGAVARFKKLKTNALMQEISVVNDDGSEVQDEIKALKSQIAKLMTILTENEELKKQLANEKSINNGLEQIIIETRDGSKAEIARLMKVLESCGACPACGMGKIRSTANLWGECECPGENETIKKNKLTGSTIEEVVSR